MLTESRIREELDTEEKFLPYLIEKVKGLTPEDESYKNYFYTMLETEAKINLLKAILEIEPIDNDY